MDSAEEKTVEKARSVPDGLLILCLRRLPYIHKQKFYPLASAGDAQDLLRKLFKAVPFGQVRQMRWLGINFKVQKEMRVQRENWATRDFHQYIRVWIQVPKDQFNSIVFVLKPGLIL